MPKFTVDVKAFINVTVEAPDRDAARAAADSFVEALSPEPNFIAGYNSATPADAPKINQDETGEFGVDGYSDVDEAE